MIFEGNTSCPLCGGKIKHYDRVKRVIRTKNRETNYIWIARVRCVQCRKIHRVLPDNIVPYKQYESEMILGVKEGLINSDTLGFEDYPCDATKKRWMSSK